MYIDRCQRFGQLYLKQEEPMSMCTIQVILWAQSAAGVLHLEQAIIHLYPNESAVRVHDANLTMLYWPPSSICQVAACFGLQVTCNTTLEWP